MDGKTGCLPAYLMRGAVAHLCAAAGKAIRVAPPLNCPLVRPLWPHLDELTTKYVDVDVGRRQNDIFDLRWD